ncbi:hypothetical protein HELRODRAFT_157299 [Helobdella robusta]|uniref:Protein phosphatase inhibitor 2 n=1 Tax=Helobdella robusta TaxID=6412 RepID=T1EM90_HELRO|nr:hypothetical protein HELRODRAFT_157299 [Helobdella robusta]ESO00866.1 hypothetical protein HELRODRAFT_157299 [Helobdella robusta]
MAELIDKKPVKGILKNASSFDTSDRSEGQQPQKSIDKGMKWDEMNILATYHPADKDYGHDKIDEPPTPYNKFDGEGDETRSGDEDESLPIDPQLLVEGLTMKTKAKVFTKVDTISSGEDEDDEEFLSEEEKEKKRRFILHRKQHYNEFQAIKLARQLLQEEDDDDDDDGERVSE